MLTLTLNSQFLLKEIVHVISNNYIISRKSRLMMSNYDKGIVTVSNLNTGTFIKCPRMLNKSLFQFLDRVKETIFTIADMLDLPLSCKLATHL